MNLDFIQYRSYKNLDMENFIDDVRSIDFENLVSVENVDEAYSYFQSAFTEVINKNMPLKKRKPVVNT
jgi:type IV secretory pathway TrbF-like protein